jgi:hypothetical protein
MGDDYRPAKPGDKDRPTQDAIKKSQAHSDSTIDGKNYGDDLFHDVPVRRGLPTDNEIFDDKNIKIHWKKSPETDEEKALFYGFHIHSKDNPYGLHTHIPGGNLLGAHKHEPGNLQGAHTHAIDTRDIPNQFLISPDSPVYLDGEHEHQDLHPDGGHQHAPNTFG